MGIRKFHLSVPKKKIIKNKDITSDYKYSNIGSRKILIDKYMTLRPSDVAPLYKILPTKAMWDDLLFRYGEETPIEHWQYVEHRQMDQGRAIAKGTHTRRRFSERDVDLWEFKQYVPIRVDNPNYDPDWRDLPYGQRGKAKTKMVESYDIKSYYVEWDGSLPFPSPIASSSSFDGIDSYIWAVYFLVNGFPDDSMWFPVPSKNPEWNNLGVGQFVPDYNLNLS
jgi:hypothetical protein